MTNSINNDGYVNNISQKQQAQRKTAPKTDRRFQAFVDEALKENNEHADQPQTSTINVSNHALKRMEQRGIELDDADMSTLEDAFATLDSKGAENSLIVYDDLSLIASIKNRTIITASKSEEMKEVTNIDSAIIVQKQEE